MITNVCSRVLLPASVILSLIFSSCKKEEVYRPAPSLSANSSNIKNAPSIGGDYTVQLLGTVKWTATSNQSWLRLVRSAGANDSYLQLSLDSNFTADARTAVVNVKGEGVDAFDISLSQSAGVTITPAPGKDLQNLDFSSGSVSVQITNLLGQNLTISSDQAWAMPTETSSSANFISMAINLDENTTTAPRSCTITVKNKKGEVIKQIALKQLNDVFGSLFYGTKWKLNRKFAPSTGANGTLNNCQQDDIYTFVKTGAQVTRTNSGLNGCSSDVETGNFTVYNGSVRTVYCYYFYDFSSYSQLEVISITSDKLVLAYSSTSSYHYEFVKVP